MNSVVYEDSYTCLLLPPGRPSIRHERFLSAQWGWSCPALVDTSTSDSDCCLSVLSSHCLVFARREISRCRVTPMHAATRRLGGLAEGAHDTSSSPFRGGASFSPWKNLGLAPQHPQLGSLPVSHPLMIAAAHPTPGVSAIALNAQLRAHAPHSMHAPRSTSTARPPSIANTPWGQTMAH